MKKLIDVCQIKAFTNLPFRENLAGIDFSNEFNSKEIQLIACEFNLSKTCYISGCNEAEFNLRWFTPKVELKHRSHLTIAAIHYLLQQEKIKNNQNFSVSTISGIIRCDANDEIYTLTMSAPESKFFEESKEENINTLNGEKAINPQKFPFIPDDGGYFYINVSSLKELMDIKPDFRKLMDLSFARNGLDKPSLYTTEKDTEGKTFAFEQDDISERKDGINISYFPSVNEFSISGKTVITFKGDLYF